MWRSRPVFSPRMRGCSGASPGTHHLDGVFPAYAGMFLMAANIRQVSNGFPRVCGDVPNITVTLLVHIKFSPRMRGCSLLFEHVETTHEVFPAYAGMFLCSSPKTCSILCFPRVCGDVPHSLKPMNQSCVFSPRMRGCSCPLRTRTVWCRVFPAYAGMFRLAFPDYKGPVRFPRVCGDVPPRPSPAWGLSKFSPRMRGCS